MQLWRLYGPARVLTAALYPHVDGTELRVFFEPEQAKDVLERKTGEVEALERRAALLRERLVDKGWVELENGSRSQPVRPSVKRRTGVLAAISVVSGVAFWWWRLRRCGEDAGKDAAA
jgi:hypothetical protein